MFFKSTQYTFTGNFGRARVGKTVVVTVLDNAGNLSANATIGSVVELGDGFYGVTITFTAAFNGYVKWNDTDDVVTLYDPFVCVEDYRADITAIKKVELNRWKIESNQLKIYDDNDVDVLYTFDLKRAGVADGETPDERMPL